VGPDRVYIRSSEPCIYRTTVEGLAALADALRNRCILYLEFDTDQFTPSGERYSVVATPSAEMVLRLPLSDAATIDITLGFSDRSDMLSTVHDLVECIRASFISTAAVYGCVFSATVSLSPDGSFVYDTEARDLLPRTVRWPDVRRFARGVFWGNALGEEICERLGGREGVIADAPVRIRHSLGSGGWLQVSSNPPASKTDIDNLARYLAPVLDWKEDDSQTSIPQGVADPEPRGVIPWILLLNRAAIEPAIPTITKLLDIPIQRLEDNREGGLLVINIHLAEIPTTAQRESIIIALMQWYDGVEHDGGMRVFRDVRDLVINGTVIRWAAETYGMDLESVLEGLRAELASVDDIDVLEVVVGTEIVG
jgi:hypothetical protein